MAEDIDSLYALYSFSQKDGPQKDFNKNVNEQDTSTQMTKLHCACEYGNKEEVIKLLEAGANIWIKDNNGNIALHFLVACTDAIEIFELIYEKAGNDLEKIKLIKAKNNAGHSPLWYAVENKRTLFEKRLIQLYKKFGMKLEKNVIDLARQKDPIPDKPIDKHINPEYLLRATESDNTELLKKLLSELCKSCKNVFNKVNNNGYDPIRIAVSHDHVENVKLLLPYSWIDSNHTKNILFIAVKHNSIEVIKYLLFTADIKLTYQNFRNKDDFFDGTVMDLCKTKLLFQRHWLVMDNPLHQAARIGNVAILTILMDFYEDVNLRSNNLQTALHIAAANKNNEIFVLIFRRSTFSLFLTDRNRETPFSIICKNNLTVLLEFIADSSILFEDVDRRKYFLKIAIETRCVWLLQYVFKNSRSPYLFFSYKINSKVYESESNIIKNKIRDDNQAFLKLAIKNRFTEGVLTLLKLDNWEEVFRRQFPSERNPDFKSPMQLLIEYMPETAGILFDKCIVNKKDEDSFFEKLYFNYGIINDDFFSSEEELISTIPNVPTQSKASENNDGINVASYSKKDENIELLSIKCNETKDEYQKFSFLKTVETYPLTLMIKYHRFSLLNHPFVVSYIDLKWNRFAKWFYYSLCIYYSFIAAGLTTLTIIAKPNNFTNADNEANNVIKMGNSGLNFEFANLVPSGIITIIFILQCALFFGRCKVYKRIRLKNRWLDILNLILTLCASLPISLFTSYQFQWNIIVVLNFCASISLLNYIKKHPRFGVYVVMIENVLTSFLRFAPIFIMVLMPFVVLFYVLLGEGSGIFSFFDTFIHTVVMMIGEFDYKDSVSSKDSLITSAMFCLFLFAVTIFLMNLLTGLAVSDTTKILEEAVLRRRIMQIENIHHIELILPKWIKTRYWDGYCKVPKEATVIEKETHRVTTPKFRKLFKWWGISKDAAKRIDDGKAVEEKVDTLKQEIGQRIDGLEEKVNEKMNEIIKMLKQR